MDARPVQQPFDAAEMVCAALNAGGYIGLSEFLQKITKTFNAYGCVLWELAPGAPVESPDAGLYALAQWLPDGSAVTIYDISLARSHTGGVVLSKKPARLRNVRTEGGHHHDHPILEKARIGPMLVVPVSFTDGVPGAVSVFRTENGELFTEEDERHLEHLGTLVPPIYQAIRDKMSLDLFRELDAILREMEVLDPQTAVWHRNVGSTLQRICHCVARFFNCVETSVFLEDPMVAPNVFVRMATTQPDLAEKQSYTKDDSGHTITGWILDHGEPVHIFDLARFSEDKEKLNLRYPGIGWGDSERIGRIMRELPQPDAGASSQPLAYIAAPVLAGQATIGAIRCFLAPDRPYFGQRDLDLLKLVAAQIAQHWQTWLSRRQVHQENESWEKLTQGIGSLKKAAQKALLQYMPEDRTVFDRALGLLQEAVPGFDILDVRLLDETRRVLKFSNWCGKAWTDQTCHRVQDPLRRTFRVDEEPPVSGGALVFRNKRPVVIMDTHEADHYSPSFNNVRRMIMAPIAVGEEAFGVLDIRGTQQADFPRHALIAAELIADQMGVYHYLMLRVRELHKVDRDLKKKMHQLESFQSTQAQTFEDLAHQLKGPLLQAQARAGKAMHGSTRELAALRGLCRKSLSVARSISILGDLQAGKPIRLKRQLLEIEELLVLLIESADDNQLLVDPDKKVVFDVQRETLTEHYAEGIDFDFGLLEQAVNCILDNAAKYSYAKTKVLISCGRTNTGRFYISVENKGIPIRRSEVNLCKNRRWRSDMAELVVGEGSGIGLWIVDNIMRAHKGDLEVLPTRDGVTQVRLIFAAPGGEK